MTLYELVEQLGRIKALDAVARPLSKQVAAVVSSRPIKDLLSGTWLGHPVHPLLTDVTIGAWTSALALDLVGGRHGQQAADRLIGLGLLSALPTAATGLSDWSDHLGEERRIGLLHAVANVAAVVCHSLSLLARLRGARTRGFAWSLAGGATLLAGGHLGGHLTYVQGLNVNRNAWHEAVDEWMPVLDDADLRDQEPVAVEAGETQVLLVRLQGRIHALAAHCGHAGGPLHEGRFEDGCVVCPWHLSTFRLEDGAVVHGPATVPQPAYETRVEDGKILIRAADQG